MDLSLTKRQGGAERASVTRLKESVDKQEGKSELSRTDCLLVSRLVKKLEDWYAEFRKQHDIVLDLTEEDTTEIEREQAVFDEHKKRLPNFHFPCKCLVSKRTNWSLHLRGGSTAFEEVR